MKFLPYQLSLVLDLLPDAPRHMAMSQSSMSGLVTAGKPFCCMDIYLLARGKTPSYDASRIPSNGNNQSGSNSACTCVTPYIQLPDAIHYPSHYFTQQVPN